MIRHTNPLAEFCAVFFSFMISWVLMLLPMPYHLDWLKPEWLFLVLIYWMFFSPRRVSLIMAWCMGLGMDVLNNGLIGQYALTLVVVAYLAAILRSRLRILPIIQQGIVVFILVSISNVLLITIQWVLGRPSQTFMYGISTLSSVFLWPLICRMMQLYERKTLG